MRKTLILGGPGAGKTRELIRRMETSLRNGVDPSRIAFVSFTNAAVDEARSRACKEFGLEPNDLPYFRTIHSLAFRELGLKPNEVVDEGHLRDLSELTGEMFTGDTSTEGPAAGRNADPLLTVDHYARMTRSTLKEAWEDHGGQIEWFRLRRFSEAYRSYKEDMGLLDFTDMLDRYVESHLPPVYLDEAFVDEAQDLTVLQWRVVEKAFANVKHLIMAGDDDQSIHRWAGAAEDYLRKLSADIVILPVSHRLPRAIFNFSQEIVRRISDRFPKDQSTEKDGGVVDWVSGAEEADLSKGTWLLLARTRAQLAPLVQVARDQGVVYWVKGASSVKSDHLKAIQAHEGLRAGKRMEYSDVAAALQFAGVKRDLDEESSYTAKELGYDASLIWHDALIHMPMEDREYYLTCLRRGEKLTAPPRVRIDTIHGSKGAEAEDVLLVTDLTSRTFRGYETDPDSEHRVFYVGLTRALNRLHLVAPTSTFSYPL